MVRLRALGSNTESGVPYTDEEINAMARKGKQRGHLPGRSVARMSIPGIMSPMGKAWNGIVAGDSGKCCSVCQDTNE
ncbi:hypothetical protein Tco_0102974 [Tanacetum coccineum]